MTEDHDVVTSHHGKALRPGLVTDTELQLHSSLAGIVSLILDVTVPDFADAASVFVLEHPLSAGEIAGADGREALARRL